MADLMDCMWRAAAQVINDKKTWADAAQCTGGPPVPWPTVRGTGYLRLLLWFTHRMAWYLREKRYGPQRAATRVSADEVAGADFQLMLRVVERAMQAADAAAVAGYGGVRRIEGGKAFELWLKRELVDSCVSSGMPRDDAFRLAGIPRSSAYRIAAGKVRVRPARKSSRL